MAYPLEFQDLTPPPVAAWAQPPPPPPVIAVQRIRPLSIGFSAAGFALSAALLIVGIIIGSNAPNMNTLSIFSGVAGGVGVAAFGAKLAHEMTKNRRPIMHDFPLMERRWVWNLLGAAISIALFAVGIGLLGSPLNSLGEGIVFIGGPGFACFAAKQIIDYCACCR